MKKRIRPNEDKCRFLGIPYRGRDKWNKHKRYSASQEQLDKLKKYEGNKIAIKELAGNNGLDLKDLHSGWIKTDNSSVYFQNPEFNKGDSEAFHKELVKSLEEHSPKYQKLIRKDCLDGHLLVIDPADLHIGKLCDSFETGEDYNNQTAVKRALDGVKGIINKAKGFNIDKINFIGGNDILHIDTPKRTTTSGTPQDTCGMWYSNFLTAKKLYVDILEILMSIADVHFTYNPSNHDYTHGFFLADVIQTHFRKSKNITFDCSISHRKYFNYGENLIGTTHGDGAKANDLPLIMANESKDWSNSKHRYIYTHHVHHKTSKDYHGVTVESLRSPSGTDSWHHRKGYGIGGIKAVEGFIHHKKHGQVARLTHIF